MFNLILYLWIALAVVVFFVLLYIPAPYGRHVRKGWGLEVPSRFAWFLMESPSLAVMLGFMLLGWSKRGPITMLLAGWWVFHYAYRSLVFPLLIRPGKHGMPLGIVFMSIAFNVINAGLNGWWLFFLHSGYYPDYWKSPAFIIGSILAFTGFLIHVHSDHILRTLRKERSGYGIPHGGLFELVSSPNYLGEIVEWLGWAIATKSPAGLAFFLWSVANLVPRALAHHRWYKVTFPNYPDKRKAIIPFIL